MDNTMRLAGLDLYSERKMSDDPNRDARYEDFNKKLKEDSDRIFRSTDISEDDKEDLRQATEFAKIVISEIESNETTDIIQSFLDFVVRLCR